MRLRCKHTAAVIFAVAAIAAVLPGQALAGTQTYSFATNVRTCYVAVALAKTQSFLMFNNMGFSGGLGSCTGPSNAEAAPWLDQADGTTDLFNISSGKEVSGTANSFYCRQMTSCSSSGSSSVIRNGNTYVARTT